MGASSALVLREGVEPSRHLGHWNLNPARLPIPAPERGFESLTGRRQRRYPGHLGGAWWTRLLSKMSSAKVRMADANGKPFGDVRAPPRSTARASIRHVHGGRQRRDSDGSNCQKPACVVRRGGQGAPLGDSATSGIRRAPGDWVAPTLRCLADEGLACAVGRTQAPRSVAGPERTSRCANPDTRSVPRQHDLWFCLICGRGRPRTGPCIPPRFGEVRSQPKRILAPLPGW